MIDVLQCPYCDLRFSTRSELEQHKAFDHPSMEQEPPDGGTPGFGSSTGGEREGNKAPVREARAHQPSFRTFVGQTRPSRSRHGQKSARPVGSNSPVQDAASSSSRHGPRFCEQCGRNLIPPDFPHVERPCAECGRSLYGIEPGEGGKGIKVREGDKLTFPAGSLKLSLDRSKATGRFAKLGIAWFVTHLLAGDIPSDPEELENYLTKCEEEADAVLWASEKLKELDLDDEDDAKRALDIPEQDRTSIEWWAMLLGALVADVRERMSSNDTPPAIVSALRLQASWSMLVFKQSLEEHVWTGYKHTALIYDIASASATTNEEAEKIRGLRPPFAELEEDVLHAWVESDADIGRASG
jgi:hypothetical protein